MLPPIVLYTHSEYSFIWPATFALLKKHAQDFAIYVCADTLGQYELPSTFTFLPYDESFVWSKRLRACLSKVPECPYVIYLQEDWLLTDFMNAEKVMHCVNVMREKNIDFLMSYVRDRAGPAEKCNYDEYVFRKTHGHYLQPAIWHRQLFERFLHLDIPLRESEGGAANRITEKCNCYVVQCTKSPHVSRTTMFYPHMHAICGGKWTFLRYPTLKALLDSYGIDTTTRGVCTTWITEYQ